MGSRFRPLLLLVVLVVLLGSGGCETLTEIVVSIDSDLKIPKELDAVGFEVDYVGGPERTKVVSKTWNVDQNLPDPITLPATVGLLPGEDLNTPVLITVSGFRESKLRLTRKAQLTFVEGRVLLLSMNLLRGCLYKVCPEGQTCGEAGCEPIEKDSNKLPNYGEDAAFVGVGDATTDIAMDAAVSDLPQPDSPLPDTNSPPDLVAPDQPWPDTVPPDIFPADTAPPPDQPWPDTLPWSDTVPPPDLVAPPDACVPPVGWWNAAYKSRYPLTITESLAGPLPAGYSVRVEVDTQALIGGGQMLASGDDLRVVWCGGATPVELDRRVIQLGTASTAIWFKTQSPVSGSDSSYHIYFGNPSAGAPMCHWADSMGAAATPSGVYLAGDDFEDDNVGASPNGWVGSGNYKIELDGANKVVGVIGSAGAADYLFSGDLSWTDVAVQARMRPVITSGNYYGLFARVDGVTNFNTLWFGLGDNSTLQAWTCQVASPTATSLTGTLRQSWPLAPPAGTTWHLLEVRVLGNTATFLYDGTSMGSHTLTGSGMKMGRIGLNDGQLASHVQYDDVVVRMYADPEPTVSLSGLQETCQ